AAPTQAATNTPAASDTPAAAVSTTPTGAASPTTAPTQATTPTTAPSGTVATYTSQALGISFSYLTSMQGQQFGVQESGDKVYVYMASTDPTTGQWVQVFQ